MAEGSPRTDPSHLPQSPNRMTTTRTKWSGLSPEGYRGNGARSMTLRSASPLRSLAALLLFFAIMFGSAVDAFACDRNDNPTVRAEQSIDSLPAPDDSNDKAQLHTLRAHVHCHNVVQLDRGEEAVSEQATAERLHFAMPSVSLIPADIALVKEPPRA